jgi:outer membrane receptor protein involved in Fe transport
LAALAAAAAQTTTATVSGRVSDAQGLPVPGAMVIAESPGLQGSRSTTTSETGDFVLTLLPPGAYAISIELAGFVPYRREITLAPTEAASMAVMLGIAAVEERVEVPGGLARPLSGTALVATRVDHARLADLPTLRDLPAALTLAPSVHATGPSGNYSIAGAVSSENLFLINGVTVNDNLRGQPHELYIEDAIQETVVATGGISAEYGRFGGGVVNVITRSGGNQFSGSFRDTFTNDRWRAYTPFEQTAIAADPEHRDTRADATVPTYEYTLGGPILRDRLWFFTAGRWQSQETGRTLAVTNVPYVFTEDNRRFEIKGTLTPVRGHRFESTYTRSATDQTNMTTFQTAIMDLNSLYDAERPMSLVTVVYGGALSSNLFVDARYSKRDETLIGVGATSTDLVDGTLLIDGSRNTRFWSPTFCGVCRDEERDNEEVFVKGTYFVSRRGLGAHTIGIGYDGFDDTRTADNHQSGSDYRLGASGTVITGAGAATEIYPRFLSNGTSAIIWQPIRVSSQGSRFRTHSLFVADDWRATNRVTLNLGLRYDRNDGVDSGGLTVARDAAWSPRLGIVVDPVGDGRWTVSGSVAKYVSAVANTIADASSPAGNADAYLFLYEGPAINADPAGPLTPTPLAVQQVFDWFFANGGTSRPVAAPPTIRGVTPQIGDALASPSVLEYAGGVGGQFGHATLRADVTYRRYDHFYALRTDLTTGRVTDSTGRAYDLSVIENTDTLEREYVGVAFQGTYRPNASLDLGGHYTVSRTWGNVEGETTNGPAASGALQYPEYKDASWNYPIADLSVDQRHRFRAWITYFPPRLPGLSVSVLQAVESGIPYGAVATSGVDPRPFVTNPGYVTPPNGSQTTYAFTAPDAFRAEGQRRTDLAVGYSYRIPRSGLQLFGQLQVINVFNHYQLCGCGGTVFQNGGTINRATIDQTVRTRVTNSALYQPFNPFTTKPVQGVHWDVVPTFGTAVNRFAFTSPRQLRVSIGVRF